MPHELTEQPVACLTPAYRGCNGLRAMRVKYLLLGLAWVSLGCPTPAKPDAGVTCTVVAPETCASPALRFADVKPLFEVHCVMCHYGELGGPWSLKTHTDIADWAGEVRDDIADCSMPPADAGTTMTDGERALILDWLRCGALE